MTTRILEKTTRDENDVDDDDAMVAVAILMMMTTAMVAATMMVMRTKLIFSSNLAAVHAGGFATGIYLTNRWKNSKYDQKHPSHAAHRLANTSRRTVERTSSLLGTWSNWQRSAKSKEQGD